MTNRPVLNRRNFLRLGANALAAGFLGGQGRAWGLEPALPTPLLGVAGEWSQSFADDFTSLSDFDRKWTKVTDLGNHNTISIRVPENVALTAEGLALRLGRNLTNDDPRRIYSGGYIRSAQFTQLYGYFECEMRIAHEPGVNNAFWMTSVPESEGDVHFELDIAECKYPDVLQGSARLWRPEQEVVSHTHRPQIDLSADFHRYSMLWSPERFSFFFDDHHYFRINNNFAHTPAQLIFSNAVASFAGKDDGDLDGAATFVRRVQVFQNIQWASPA